MAFVSITKLEVGDPIKKSFLDTVVDNLDDLDSRQGISTVGDIANASFETGNVGSQPSNWTAGGSENGALSDTTDEQGLGTKGYKFSWSGAVAEATLTSELFPISGAGEYVLTWFYKSSAANNSIRVNVNYYQKDQTTAISNENLVNASSGWATTWTQDSERLTVPSAARWAAITLAADDNGSSGSVIFDGINLSEQVKNTSILIGQIGGTISSIGANVAGSSGINNNLAYALGWSSSVSGTSSYSQMAMGSYSTSSNEYRMTVLNHGTVTGSYPYTVNYIQASPPYDWGEGIAGTFLHALVDANGTAHDIMSSPDPHVKLSKWHKIPHPWVFDDLRGLTPVMLDPMSAFAHDFNRRDIEERMAIITRGKLSFHNAPIKRRLPNLICRVRNY